MLALLQLAHPGRLGPHLLRAAEQLDEHLHLGLQRVRDDRGEDVVHRPQRIAALRVGLALADGRDEDDRRVRGAPALADQRRGLEAVQRGHLDVQQHHRELPPQELLQRLLAGAGAHQLGVEVGQDQLQHLELGRVVVDDEHRRTGPRAGGLGRLVRGRRVGLARRLGRHSLQEPHAFSTGAQGGPRPSAGAAAAGSAAAGGSRRASGCIPWRRPRGTSRGRPSWPWR